MKKFLLTVISFFVITIGYSQTVYTFNGNGNWSDTTNWLHNSVPPSTLLSGDEIIIDSNRTCYLNIPQIISTGASLIVLSGANLVVMGNLSNFNETDSTQYLIVSVDSSEIDTLLYVRSSSSGANYASYSSSTNATTLFVFRNPSPENPYNTLDYPFIGDTIPGVYPQNTNMAIGTMPDTSISHMWMRTYYVAPPFTITITEYDTVGGFVSGYFSNISLSYFRYVPYLLDNGEDVTANHLINCKFRLIRTE